MKKSKADDAVKLSKEQADLLAQYYEEFFSQLFHYANSSFRNPALAEEAVQETFRRVCERIDAFMDSTSKKGWLYGILKNVMKEIRYERERLAKLLTALSALKGDDERVSFEGDKAVVNIHYAGLLKPEDFSLLCRVAIDKYSMLEAAEEFGLTLEGCKKRVQRRTKELSELLKNI